MSEHLTYLDDASFNDAIEKGVTLVDFYAEWCGPCKMIAPIVEKLSVKYAGKAKIAKLDIDKSQKVTAHYEVTSIPTLILFKDGKEIKRIVGLRDEETLKSLIDSTL
jgi:thioredoxin 1